ncbi:MAG TPA: response regulator [Candidatus Angelobacter sp.]|nr:response regulator [Candidatus Angelobacter sp.]
MNSIKSNGPVEILLVEDNPGDVRLTREAFLEARLQNHLSVVPDGIEALDFLRRKGKHANAPRPDLILLDLNLPRKDGREVLTEIKADPDLKAIPVVVLTTSAADQDIKRSYELHANCYITKPVDLNQFLETMNVVEEFWLSVVKLPPKKSGEGDATQKQ